MKQILQVFLQTSAEDWNIVQLFSVFILNLKTERQLEFSNENLVIHSSWVFTSLHIWIFISNPMT